MTPNRIRSTPHSFTGTVILSFFLFASSTARSQHTAHEDTYWTRVYWQAQVATSLSLHLEVDNRRLTNPDRQTQFIAHTHVHYRARRNIDLAAGFTYSAANRPSGVVQPELRPFQEATLEKTLGSRWLVHVRFRFEERFLHNVSSDNQRLETGYTMAQRYRLRSGIAYSIRRNEKHEWIVRCFDELMLQTGTKVTRTFDQNRVYGAIEWRPDLVLGLELGYMHILQGQGSADFLQRDVIRLTVFVRTSLKKKANGSSR